jgi:hypothetical protein
VAKAARESESVVLCTVGTDAGSAPTYTKVEFLRPQKGLKEQVPEPPKSSRGMRVLWFIGKEGKSTVCYFVTNSQITWENESGKLVKLDVSVVADVCRRQP